MRKWQKGFTLIELMVVIGIIVMLATLMVVNYQGASKKARDSRRAADLEQLRSQLELLYTESNEYPDTNPSVWAPKLSIVSPKNVEYNYNRTNVHNYVLCTVDWEGSPIPPQNALAGHPDQYCVQNP